MVPQGFRHGLRTFLRTLLHLNRGVLSLPARYRGNMSLGRSQWLELCYIGTAEYIFHTPSESISIYLESGCRRTIVLYNIMFLWMSAQEAGGGGEEVQGEGVALPRHGRAPGGGGGLGGRLGGGVGPSWTDPHKTLCEFSDIRTGQGPRWTLQDMQGWEKPNTLSALSKLRVEGSVDSILLKLNPRILALSDSPSSKPSCTLMLKPPAEVLKPPARSPQL